MVAPQEEGEIRGRPEPKAQFNTPPERNIIYSNIYHHWLTDWLADWLLPNVRRGAQIDHILSAGRRRPIWKAILWASVSGMTNYVQPFRTLGNLYSTYIRTSIIIRKWQMLLCCRIELNWIELNWIELNSRKGGDDFVKKAARWALHCGVRKVMHPFTIYGKDNSSINAYCWCNRWWKSVRV